MDRRQEDRKSTRVPLTCRVPASPHNAVMLDLSQSGCRLEFKESVVELGGTAVIDPPGAPRLIGRVVWTEGRTAGVQFEDALEGPASIALGLEEPEPAPAPEPERTAEAEAAGPAQSGCFLRHWVRRLTGRSA